MVWSLDWFRRGVINFYVFHEAMAVNVSSKCKVRNSRPEMLTYKVAMRCQY